MPHVTPTSRVTNSIDPNANSLPRMRRNWQRIQQQLNAGSTFGGLITAVSAPLAVTGGTASLTISPLLPGLALDTNGALGVNIDNLTIQVNQSDELFATNILYNGVNNGTVSNTTAETFFPAFTPFVSPASPVGSGVELTAYFAVQAINANTDTLTIRTYYNGNLLFTASGIPVGGAVANTPMYLVQRVLATSTNTLQVTGELRFNGIQEVLPTPATTVTATLSITPAIAVSAQWSVASTNDIVAMSNYVVTLIGAV